MSEVISLPKMESKPQFHAEEENKTIKTKKPVEPGIIYLSRIPTLMNVNIVRRSFERFGETGRIFLQPDSKKSWMNVRDFVFNIYWCH